MDTLHSMRMFVRVATAGSFTAAARNLNTTTAYASRAVSDLEAHLRIRLLTRTTRRIALTEAGRRYLQRCEQILSKVDEAEAEASEGLLKPSGKLKVHATAALGQHYIVQVISRYQRRFPDVVVDLTLSQRMPDLLEEGYDVALVFAQTVMNSRMGCRRLASAFSIACASPGYLERNGRPLVPSDLCRHTCLQSAFPNSSRSEWTLDGPNGQEVHAVGGAAFQVNSVDALAVAVREGMGVALLPIYQAIRGLRNGELVWILQEYTAENMYLYALHSSQKYLDVKIAAWIEFLQEEIPKTLAEDQCQPNDLTSGELAPKELARRLEAIRSARGQ
ncbi:DNA-binding transcriptional LysR family regulator [Paraburkholderia sp. GAS199]|uniref:LysR family transcriptional regulator n=1 Tax=Paraburkholderia sp. GAS199 TaxID=3035126 RepID=UPI003D231290